MKISNGELEEAMKGVKVGVGAGRKTENCQEMVALWTSLLWCWAPLEDISPLWIALLATRPPFTQELTYFAQHQVP
jgi:hypothetical protein